MIELLREVRLPPGIGGHLYITRMPGRFGDFAGDRQQIEDRGIDTVLCLAPPDEIRSEALEYAEAIHAGTLPWGDHRMLPIPDFGVPEDRDAFFAQVCGVVGALRADRRVLIHCGAGIGRSGTVATAVLMALGLNYRDALQNVMAAGGQVESWSQEQLLRWLEEKLAAMDSPCSSADPV